MSMTSVLFLSSLFLVKGARLTLNLGEELMTEGSVGKAGRQHSEVAVTHGIGAGGVKYNVVMIGNPGSGKSTLLNGLIGDRKGELKFQSGVTFGGGMTSKLGSTEVDGVRYMDTPGLADVHLREQAAEAIKQALQMGGKFKIFFVCILNAGRVSPADVTTMALVLNAVPELKTSQFSIIINKVDPETQEKMKKNDEAGKKAIEFYLTNALPRKTDLFYYVPLIESLNNEDNVTWTASSELKEFVDAAPAPTIHADKVGDVPVEDFKTMNEQLETKIEALRKMEGATAEMNKQIEEIQKARAQAQKEDAERREKDERNFAELANAVGRPDQNTPKDGKGADTVPAKDKVYNPMYSAKCQTDGAMKVFAIEIDDSAGTELHTAASCPMTSIPCVHKCLLGATVEALKLECGSVEESVIKATSSGNPEAWEEAAWHKIDDAMTTVFTADGMVIPTAADSSSSKAMLDFFFEGDDADDAVATDPKREKVWLADCHHTKEDECNKDAGHPRCSWKSIPDEKISDDLKKKGFKDGSSISCYPTSCLGMTQEACTHHGDVCQWDWVKDDDTPKKSGLEGWQLSCIPKDNCDRFQHDACDLHPTKCNWEWTGVWETSCKVGPAKDAISKDESTKPDPATRKESAHKVKRVIKASIKHKKMAGGDSSAMDKSVQGLMKKARCNGEGEASTLVDALINQKVFRQDQLRDFKPPQDKDGVDLLGQGTKDAVEDAKQEAAREEDTEAIQAKNEEAMKAENEKREGIAENLRGEVKDNLESVQGKAKENLQHVLDFLDKQKLSEMKLDTSANKDSVMGLLDDSGGSDKEAGAGTKLSAEGLMRALGLDRGTLIMNPKENPEAASRPMKPLVQLKQSFRNEYLSILDQKLMIRPSIASESHSWEFRQADMAEVVSASMESLGDSSSNSWYAEASAGAYGVSVSAAYGQGNSESTTKENSNEKMKSKKSQQYVKITHTNEPRALFSLPVLALEALPDVWNLFKRFRGINMADDGVKTLAKQLMLQYGTHFCPVNMLGGRWTINAKSTSDEEKESATLRQATSIATEKTKEVSASVSGSYGFYSASVGGGMSWGEGHEEAQGTDDKDQKGSKKETVTVEQSWLGGKSGAPVAEWRGSLEEDQNSNWRIIDKYVETCVSMWDFIGTLLVNPAETDENDAREDMKHVEKLTEAMCKIWHGDEDFMGYMKTPKYLHEGLETETIDTNRRPLSEEENVKKLGYPCGKSASCTCENGEAENAVKCPVSGFGLTLKRCASCFPGYGLDENTRLCKPCPEGQWPFSNSKCESIEKHRTVTRFSHNHRDQITEISINCFGQNTFDFQMLDGLPNLEVLTVAQCPLKGQAEMKRHSGLERLDVRVPCFVDEKNKFDIDQLHKFGGLKSFTLEGAATGHLEGLGAGMRTNDYSQASVMAAGLRGDLKHLKNMIAPLQKSGNTFVLKGYCLAKSQNFPKFMNSMKGDKDLCKRFHTVEDDGFGHKLEAKYCQENACLDTGDWASGNSFRLEPTADKAGGGSCR